MELKLMKAVTGDTIGGRPSSVGKANKQLGGRITEADFLSLDAQLLIRKAATNFPCPPRAT
jgi:hypothetical protein